MGVPSLELMEAAGRAAAEAVARAGPEGPVRVVCGKGNNAGDGLVAARYLAEAGFEVEALLLWPADELSGDAAANLERFAAEHVERRPRGRADRFRCDRRRDLRHRLLGRAARAGRSAIAAIYACGAPVVACDIASGVDASSGEVAGAAVEADVTVGFHAAKVGHLVAPGKWHTGELRVAPIGIPDGAPGEPWAGSIEAEVLDLAPRRGARSTKFSSGQVASPAARGG